MIVKHNPGTKLSAAALSRFAAQAKRAARLSGEVNVLVTDDAELRALNRQFRRKNKPTDVLSFPAQQGGDIAISADIALENAARLGHSLSSEVKVLILHGMLHLAGYDHESDTGQMARKESKLRRELKLPMTLIERASAGAGPRMRKKR